MEALSLISEISLLGLFANTLMHSKTGGPNMLLQH